MPWLNGSSAAIAATGLGWMHFSTRPVADCFGPALKQTPNILVRTDYSITWPARTRAYFTTLGSSAPTARWGRPV